MSNPGEYFPNLLRTTFVNCPVVGGYVAARLRREDSSATSGYATVGTFVLANNSSLPVSVKLTQADDVSPSGLDSTGTPSGIRYDLGAAVTLVPGGSATFQLSAYKQYIEAWGTGDAATPNGTLTMQINSITRWAQLSFRKDDTTYAPNLWDVKSDPVSTSIPNVPIVDL